MSYIHVSNTGDVVASLLMRFDSQRLLRSRARIAVINVLVS